MNQENNSVEGNSNFAFINDIRVRKSLWKRTPFVAENVKRRLWIDVANTYECTADEAKKRWQNLRKGFSRQLNKIPKTAGNLYEYHPRNFESQWPYYGAMLFLVDTDRVQKTNKRKSDLVIDRAAKKERLDVSNLNNSNDLSLADSIASRRSDVAVDWSVSVPNNSKNEDNNGSIDHDQDVTDSVAVEVLPDMPREIDGDYHFLMGLHPFLNGLTLKEKVNFQLNIYKIVEQLVRVRD